MHVRRFAVPLVPLLLGLIGGALRAGVIVVDPGGGPGGAALLQAAIDSAANGDILLVRDGDYLSAGPGTIVMADKALSLVGDGSSGHVALPGLRVSSAPGIVLVRGLDFHAPRRAEAVSVQSCRNPVWIEDCRLFGADGKFTTAAQFLAANAHPGLQVSYSSAVLAVRCESTGGAGLDVGVDGSPIAMGGAHGVGVQNASVALFDSSVHGGPGGDGDQSLFIFPADGGHGLHLFNESTGVVAGCELIGGDEGDNDGKPASTGSGLVAAFESFAFLRGTRVQAGEVHGAGLVAPDMTVPAGLLTSFPAARRSLSVPAPLREGQAGAVSLHGLQGDAAWIITSLDTDWLLDVAHQGTIHVPIVGGPYLVALVTPISAPTGEATLPFIAPTLPAAVGDGLILFLQAGFVGSDGTTLGAPSALVLVDGAL